MEASREMERTNTFIVEGAPALWELADNCARLWNEINFSYIERFLSSHGVSIHVVDGEVRNEPHKELVEDLIAVVTSFAERLYGMRSHKKRRVVETLERALRDD